MIQCFCFSAQDSFKNLGTTYVISNVKLMNDEHLILENLGKHKQMI